MLDKYVSSELQTLRFLFLIHACNQAILPCANDLRIQNPPDLNPEYVKDLYKSMRMTQTSQ